MCRILGIKNFNFENQKYIIENFIQLSENGKVLEGDSPGHKDGWGIAYYKNGKAALIRSAGYAKDEKEKILKILKKIKESKIFFFHLRKSAWQNTTELKHSHPFKYNNCLFAHNGTVRDYKSLLKLISNPFLPSESALDTEVFFRFILSQAKINLEQGFKMAIGHIKKQNTYSSLTSILSDGINLYAYREYLKKSNYYSLYKTKINDSVFICSEKISSAAKWEIIKRNKFYVF